MSNIRFNNSRREFLKNISLSSGGLLLGFSFMEAEASDMPALMPKDVDIAGFNSYISIANDGMISVFSPNPELGQNIKTSFAMVVCDELDADWNKVKVIQAPLDTSKFDRQLT
ncbi:MAG TPA: hypothetical protein VK166_18075, partial [Chitinophagaceae bacterium]|nr:hypothetical protein [Chitinophagaceae bacterium]